MINGLVINDQKDEIYILKRALSGVAKMDEAHNGMEGVAKLKENPDFIILDLHMPVLDGFAVLDSMTKEQKEKTLVMSCSDNGETMAKVMQKGCVNFLDTGASRNVIEHTLTKMGVLKKDGT
jgi:CheY-like chemotaxis protein